jgi:hypothetical protein
MCSFRCVVCLVAVAVLGAAIAGCSNPGQGAAPGALEPVQARSALPVPAFLRVDYNHLAPLAPVHYNPNALPKGLAYVSQFGAHAVNAYNKNNKSNAAPVCSINGVFAVIGIGTDKAKNVWVPQGISKTITKYAPNCGSPTTVLTSTNGQPSGIAFDSRSNAYVVDSFGPSQTPGNVAFFPAGSTMATRVLRDKSIGGQADGLAVHDGNVYLSYVNTGNAGAVIEFPRGKMPGKIFTGITTSYPGGILFDSSDNLVVVDIYAASASVYAPPYNGPPTKTFPLHGGPVLCNFSKSETKLYCADYKLGQADVYAYPSGNYLYSWNNGLSASLAPEDVLLVPQAPG